MFVCVSACVVSSATTLTGVGSCFAASGTELVIMLIWNVTQRECVFPCALWTSTVGDCQHTPVVYACVYFSGRCDFYEVAEGSNCNGDKTQSEEHKG